MLPHVRSSKYTNIKNNSLSILANLVEIPKASTFKHEYEIEMSELTCAKLGNLTQVLVMFVTKVNR